MWKYQLKQADKRLSILGIEKKGSGQGPLFYVTISFINIVIKFLTFLSQMGQKGKLASQKTKSKTQQDFVPRHGLPYIRSVFLNLDNLMVCGLQLSAFPGQHVVDKQCRFNPYSKLQSRAVVLELLLFFCFQTGFLAHDAKGIDLFSTV